MMRVATRWPCRIFLRRESTGKILKTNAASVIADKLDALLRGGQNESDRKQRDAALDIAKTLLHRSLPLNDEAMILSKLKRFNVLRGSFWSDYVAILDKRINAVYKLRQHDDSVASSEHTDKTDINLRSLLKISRLLSKEGETSSAIGDLFVRWVKHNAYYLVPQQVSSFTGMLEYLVVAGNHDQLVPQDFDVIAECAQEIEPRLLVDALYLLGKLGLKNEAMITTVGRVVHNDIAKGNMSPYHKTKLARAYALLKHEHITFFMHIAEELRVIFDGKDAGKYQVAATTTGRRYVEGIGSDEFAQPSGIICNVLPRLRTEIEASDNAASVEAVTFTGSKDQLYSDGQIVYILDSMLYLNIHHLESYFRRLLSSTIKHCYVPTSLEQFDVEQLRSAVTLLAHCGKTADDTVLELITKRFIQAYVDGDAKNHQLALFLKDLVKQTRKATKTVNRRGRVCFKSLFVAPRWLEKPLAELESTLGGPPQPSMLEACCTAICEKVHSFDLVDLTSCIRSVAYLGFRNESFYQAFIPYFKEKMSSMNNVGIANMTQVRGMHMAHITLQALTKAKVRDDHLFYLMGRQHQLYLQGDDEAHKLVVVPQGGVELTAVRRNPNLRHVVVHHVPRVCAWWVDRIDIGDNGQRKRRFGAVVLFVYLPNHVGYRQHHRVTLEAGLPWHDLDTLTTYLGGIELVHGVYLVSHEGSQEQREEVKQRDGVAPHLLQPEQFAGGCIRSER
ncbi:ATP-dependent Clp protease proteolytic subunit [Babesia caballi]|uniref:ATP-dependent Clp protease proteolytic subunit n=1 Tax=Babesia caballi TaxID=5871 RepID=A0AAV4LYW0_BABCB|nr:ATP-dependent Clp protease proteolytic subunit [Babesia caballi]